MIPRKFYKMPRGLKVEVYATPVPGNRPEQVEFEIVAPLPCGNKITHVVAGLYQYECNWYVTHCYTLNPNYLNQGLGIKLYAHMILYGLRRGWQVSSSNTYSEEARRVWASDRLNSVFSINYENGFFKVLGVKC